MNSFEFEYVTTETEPLQTEPDGSQTVMRPFVPTPEPQTIPQAVSPAAAGEESAIVGLVSSPQSPYQLGYSCVLIPRFSDHYLSGDITEDLPRWMKDICISYGWRLDGVVIRPGYIQWVMTVPLSANPAQFIRVMRQLTSQRILEDYPRYARKNVSSDFWAPGFSIAPGNQFQTVENINDFILQTRRQQGISV